MGAEFQRIKDFQTSRDYTTLEPFLHEDYLFLREEGLRTREDCRAARRRPRHPATHIGQGVAGREPRGQDGQSVL